MSHFISFRRYIVFILPIFSLFIITSCIKEQQIQDKDTKLYIDSMMSQYYYWVEEMPTNISMSTGSIYDYFENHLVSKDRWSWMTSAQEWNESQTGVYKSYGASISQPIEYYGDYSVMIRYVHPGSPFAVNGVKRGWTLTHIGGVEVMTLIRNDTFASEYNKESNSFTFKDETGVSRTLQISAEVISTRSSLITDVFDAQDFKGLTGKVAYFNYLTFNNNMLSDIRDAFARFYSEGVSDLILDLRYNGGGSTNASSVLADYLAPSSAQGKVLVSIEHNSLNSTLNASTTIQRQAQSLELNRIFIITGKATASASEVVINGLKPLFGEANVIQVGDTTYGKPNGMYVFAYPSGTSEDYYANAEYVFLPICFYSVNANGFGGYEDGILPSKYWPDDLYDDWGVNEGIINACLTYIATGAYPPLPTKLSTKSDNMMGSERIAVSEDAKGYGTFLLDFPIGNK